MIFSENEFLKLYKMNKHRFFSVALFKSCTMFMIPEIIDIILGDRLELLTGI